MFRRNHALFWRNIGVGVLLASTCTLFACGGYHNMPVGGMPGQSPTPSPSPNPMPNPMSHPRPHP